jgi:hypothetical protein
VCGATGIENSTLESLPLACRLFLEVFKAQPGHTMQRSDVASKLVNNTSRPMSREEAEKIIDAMASVVPEWCSVDTTRLPHMVKINFRVTFGAVLAKIVKLKKQR